MTEPRTVALHGLLFMLGIVVTFVALAAVVGGGVFVAAEMIVVGRAVGIPPPD